MPKREGVLAFLIVTFGLTWAVELGMLAKGVSLTGQPSPAPQIIVALIMFIPGLSAFIVRKFITREGFGDAGLRFGRRSYYLIAWLLPVILSVVTISVAVALRQAQFDFSLSQLMEIMAERAPEKPLPSPGSLLFTIFVSSMTMAVIVNSIFTFGEEFGWRGYLLMRLLPKGELQAMVLTGIIWGIWHTPLILMGFNYPGHPVLGIGLMIVFCVLLSIIFGWLRLASDSIFTPTIAHASLNGPAMALLVVLKGHNVIISTLLGLIGFAVMGSFSAWLYFSGRLRTTTDDL